MRVTHAQLEAPGHVKTFVAEDCRAYEALRHATDA